MHPANELADRLDSLERSNQRLRLAVLLLITAAPLPYLLGSGPGGADEVRARRFVLVGPEGGEQATWSAAKGGSELQMHGPGSTLLITADASGARAMSLDSVGGFVLGTYPGSDGPLLELGVTPERGAPGVRLTGGNRPRIDVIDEAVGSASILDGSGIHTLDYP